MKGNLRYILIAVAVLVVIVLILPFVISVNGFRPTIESKLSSALGRQVQVGDLSLSIFSGSLSADNLSISDDPAFSKLAFLTAKSFKVGVDLLPLIFSRALHITGVTIESPEVILLKNPEGRWNFSSLGASGISAAPTSAAAHNAPAPPPQADGSEPNLVVDKLELKDGRLTIGSTNSPERSVYDSVNLTASGVAMTSQFPMMLTIKLPGGGNLKLDGKVGPVDASDAAMSPIDAKLTISGLDLASAGLVDASAGIGGFVDFDTTLSSKAGEAQTQGTVNLNKMKFVKNSSPATVPIEISFGSNYDLKKSEGVLNPSTVKIGTAVSHLSGTYDLKGKAPVLNLKIEGQNMPVKDLEGILPTLGVVLPKGASLQSGTLGMNLVAAGPTNQFVTTGHVSLLNAKLTGFDIGSKMSALGSFAGLPKTSDTTIEKMNTDLRVAQEGIQISNLDAVASGIGELTGGGTVGADSSLNFKMRAILSGGAASLLTAKSGKNAGIPFSIEGTTSDPKFVPDVGGIMKSEAGAALGDTGVTKLGGAVGGLLGKKKTTP